MSRPTDDKKASTVILRINAETKSYLEEKAAENQQNISEYVRSMIIQEKNGGNNNVIQNISSEIMSDIETMCSFSEITVGDFMEKLCEAMNNGDVMYEDGKFTSQSTEEIDLSRFREACDAKGVPYQKMIDKATQNVWGS